jgi:hypothetical protein
VVRNCIQGIDCLHVHDGLFQLELLIDQHFLAKGVALSLEGMYFCLLLHLCCLLHILLRIFLLIGSDQLLCLILEDLDLVIKLLLLLLKCLDLDVQIIQSSFNFNLLFRYFLSL